MMYCVSNTTNHTALSIYSVLKFLVNYIFVLLRFTLNIQHRLNSCTKVISQWYMLLSSIKTKRYPDKEYNNNCYYYAIWMSLVTGIFCLVLLLKQRWFPPLRLQASDCSTFRIMCDVPSTAVFCSESIECFPGTASKFFLKLLVTISVAPIITGTIVHFRFHISYHYHHHHHHHLYAGYLFLYSWAKLCP